MRDDHARGEQVEHELTAMIERRHNQRVAKEGERPAEEAWQQSKRRYFAAQAKAEHYCRLAWCRYLQEMYARRSEEWKRKAEALLQPELTDERRTA